MWFGYVSRWRVWVWIGIEIVQEIEVENVRSDFGSENVLMVFEQEMFSEPSANALTRVQPLLFAVQVQFVAVALETALFGLFLK